MTNFSRMVAQMYKEAQWVPPPCSDVWRIDKPSLEIWWRFEDGQMSEVWEEWMLSRDIMELAFKTTISFISDYFRKHGKLKYDCMTLSYFTFSPLQQTSKSITCFYKWLHWSQLESYRVGSHGKAYKRRWKSRSFPTFCFNQGALWSFP